MESLSSIVPSLSVTAASVLANPDIYSHISALLRRPNSGAGDNNLCRWLYDTFQSGVPDLQLLVLRFLPVIAGAYLSRVADRKPQAGFEAVLLALYAHETASRAGQAVSATIPDLSNPSVYHESKAAPNKNNSAAVAVVSPSLEPHGTVRSTRRARIVGVALELFYAKIPHMPASSKVDFCEFCKVWSGQDGDVYRDSEEGGAEVKLQEEEKKKSVKEVVEGRVPLPWELLQPVMRILGHCLLGPNNKDVELFGAATEACRCLFARTMHDVNPKAILPMRSLLRLSKTVMANNKVDHTELPFTDVISL
ncbi:Hyccin protein [Spatholobus suberectus]|nr:Hyccin protein [Spatholobus suberectus]